MLFQHAPHVTGTSLKASFSCQQKKKRQNKNKKKQNKQNTNMLPKNILKAGFASFEI